MGGKTMHCSNCLYCMELLENNKVLCDYLGEVDYKVMCALFQPNFCIDGD